MNLSTVILTFATINVIVAIYIIWALGKHGDKKTVSQQIILDTCALIDGRVIDIIHTGFISQPILVPQFVLAELQYLADHGDSHKRERARFGLDIVRELQAMPRIKVTITSEDFAQIKEVDDKLIALAKKTGSMLYTIDYNLNKVAQIEGVIVLNVNELAQAMRPQYLPGEHLDIKITQVGQEPTQGVGYLDDGTMVVVEHAAKRIGQRIQVECSRILQTQAGKMMFAIALNQNQNWQQKQRPNKPAQPRLQVPQAN
ncbi:MAG TPA: TRAM domain-containing protein [Patescibacteria group bacterium]|jgi:uncharacterized protein YacL|nr:TRAM domain-containing protein [Patescibacteria group bacterium]